VRPVVIPGALVDEMKAHARETYPDECCGFLVGAAASSAEPETRTITSLVRARNEFDGERRRRFLIRPEEIRDMERHTESTGHLVVGFYHSHPDHPARPSLFDQEHAWPWYTYIVLSVTTKEVPEVGAFELDPESSVFQEASLHVMPAATASVVGG
jgi:proteasome lid subunit RPN8/RPN11